MTRWIEAWRREKDLNSCLPENDGWTIHVDVSMNALKKVCDSGTVLYARLYFSSYGKWKRGRWMADLEPAMALYGDGYGLSVLSMSANKALDNLKFEIALLHSGGQDE